MAFRLRSLTATLSLVAAITLTVASPVALAVPPPCTQGHHTLVGADGATATSNTHLNGVSGNVYIPEQSLINLNGEATTAADVAAIVQDSLSRFFQIGWYVGVAGGLPNVTVPTAFVGEGSNPGGETLTRINVALPVNTYVNFKLLQDENPSSPTFRAYRGYINGQLVWTSTMTTTGDVTPRFLGETNWECADMYALATTSTSGPTLMLHHANGNWAFWQQHLNFRSSVPSQYPGCWYNTRINGLGATVLAGSISSC